MTERYDFDEPLVVGHWSEALEDDPVWQALREKALALRDRRMALLMSASSRGMDHASVQRLLGEAAGLNELASAPELAKKEAQRAERQRRRDAGYEEDDSE